MLSDSIKVTGTIDLDTDLETHTETVFHFHFQQLNAMIRIWTIYIWITHINTQNFISIRAYTITMQKQVVSSNMQQIKKVRGKVTIA